MNLQELEAATTESYIFVLETETTHQVVILLEEDSVLGYLIFKNGKNGKPVFASTEKRALLLSEKINEITKEAFNEMFHERIKRFIMDNKAFDVSFINYIMIVKGDTYSYRAQLKKMGFIYSKSAKIWYFNPKNLF